MGWKLLIEPIWNRNVKDFVAACGDSGLLIEPIWNRNGDPASPWVYYLETFNRTNLE